MRKSTVLGGLLALTCSISVYAELPDFTQLFDGTVPAVVNIEARTESENSGEAEQVPEFFRRFFDVPEGGGNMPERVAGGTGFIIDSDGYIMTNHHVVDGATEITVRLHDRSEYQAEVIGSDPASDVALLKIEADDLPKLAFGESESLKPGEWVFAIGSPFNFDYSITKGIVSAKGRSFNRQQYVPFIQTDVPINRGNSGGPLLNMEGEVVGINSQIFSNTGGYMGLSFAIPIEIAQSVGDQLRENGRVRRGLLGVGIQDVNKELADTLGLDDVVGALVNNIEPDSAADNAGVELRDVILEFNGKKISRFSDLPPLVGATIPGTEAEMVVFRDGKRKTLTVEVGELPAEATIAATNTDRGETDGGRLGIVVENVVGDLQRRMDISGGVVIRSVTGQNARRAGLRAGDVISMIDQLEIMDTDEFANVVANIETGDRVALLVHRGQASTFVVIRAE